jgi:hypothetical protein
MGGAIGPIAGSRPQAGPFQCDTIRPNRRQGLSALPAPTHVVGQPDSARIRQGTTMQVGVSHAMLSVLVTHRAGSAVLYYWHQLSGSRLKAFTANILGVPGPQLPWAVAALITSAGG